MPEAGETGSTEEMFKCPVCGEAFPTEGKDEGDCPVEGHHCTRENCRVLNASDVGF